MGCQVSSPGPSTEPQSSDRRLNIAQPDQASQYKLIIVGDIAVGKSALVQRLLGKAFRSEHVSTIGTAFTSVRIKPKDDVNSIKVQLWDTAGEERYRSMSKFFFRSTQVGILVFDVQVVESLHKLKGWYEDILRVSPTASFIVVGNKVDCDPSLRVVSKDEGQQFADAINSPYIETSAKTGENVMEMFRVAAQLSLNNVNKEAVQGTELEAT